MKNLFINRIIKRNEKIKAEATIAKQEVANKNKQIKNEQPKEIVTEDIVLAKESRVLPID